MAASLVLVKFCVRPSFPFGIKGGMLDVSVLVPDHCQSIYFRLAYIESRSFALSTSEENAK